VAIDVLEQFSQQLPNSEQALVHQARSDRDVNFLLSHMDEWRQTHPNRWVAVHNETFLIEDTQGKLLEAIRLKGVPLAEVLIDFISEQRVAYLL
jgi:hypothetical protein